MDRCRTCRQEAPLHTRKWCPTCEHFYKDFGLNNCKLASWSLHPVHRNDAVDEWIKENIGKSTRIHDDANDCPGWGWNGVTTE